ncbi:MAG TPA: ComEC/Rec2 family competence protein [Rhizomicrobium sp.]|nr:ComEC/Rec2 family competence protein [Rhizomicrobium sp.]
MANIFLAERDRWPLWLPVFLGIGCGLYLALPFEPLPLWGWIMLAAGLILAGLALAGWLRWPLALAAALLLGFGIAKLNEMRLATPVLARPVITHLTARLVSLEPRGPQTRAVLDQVRSGALDPAPSRIRVSFRGVQDMHPGDWLSLTARLDTPPAPSEPGAADSGRSLFFQSIGAVGFALGRAHPVLAADPPGLGAWLTAMVEALRFRMTMRIQAVLPGSTGGIASALITGERGGIAQEDEDALRDAGLAHVLAIAGLHMALVGGGVFWLLRAAMAGVPALALRHPIKKWAAAGALAASCFYLVISGASPSAVRAFVMLAMVMIAILLDRPALSMRSLALAAAILLLARPQDLAEPGFQMSFAAVAALVAVAEWEAGRERIKPRGPLYRWLHGIAVTSLVGSFATLPFALFHFGRATHYAVLGNLIAMPVMALWVMPAAALSVALMPLGLEGGPLHLLGQGIAVMVAMGKWVSGLPGAVSLAPAMPMAALLLMTAGGLWLVIWRRRWRWWGLLPVLAGIAVAWTARLPDMLVAADGRTVAIRGPDGLLHLVRKADDKYAARDWLRRDGDTRAIADAVGVPGMRCDGMGCVMKARDGELIAVSLKPEALTEDCARAVILVSAAQARNCKGPAMMIDQKAAATGEGWRISLSPMPTAESVRAYRGERPWVMQASP